MTISIRFASRYAFFGYKLLMCAIMSETVQASTVSELRPRRLRQGAPVCDFDFHFAASSMPSLRSFRFVGRPSLSQPRTL